MTPEETAVLVGVAGYTAWSNCLVGNQAPRVKAYYERTSKPQPGDLVVETSSLFLRMRDEREPEVCVGVLVKREVETITGDDEGDYEYPRSEEAWYIKSLSRPDDVEPFRWVNATFVSIPRTSAEREEFYGGRP